MKKMIGILLLFSLLFSGCAKEPEKTEEERRAEIRAEILAEMEANEEKENEEKENEEISDDREMSTDETVVKENSDTDKEKPSSVEDEENEEQAANEPKVDPIILTGALSYNYAPYFVFLEIAEYDEGVTFNGKEYMKIMFNQEEVNQYITRDNFAYNPEGFPVLDYEPYFNDYVSIEFDLSTASETNLDYLYVENCKVISVNYEELVDHSSEDYPIKYYQDVISSLCFFMYGADQPDVKDNPGYENNPDFREAVDKAINEGYQIVQEDGYYRIGYDDVINISSVPTLEEMFSLLNISDSDLTLREDGGYFMYITTYENEDILFYIFHDVEQLSDSEKVFNITIKTPKYSLYGIEMGTRLNHVYEMLDAQYNYVYNHHAVGDEDPYVQNVYDVDGLCLILNNKGFNYVGYYIEESELVDSIHIYELLD